MPDTNIKKWSIELDANTEKLRKKLEAGELLKPNEVKKLQNFLKNIIGVAAKDAEIIGKKVSAGFKDIDTKGLEDALEFIKGMFKDINKGKNPISDWATEGEKTYKKFSQLEASVSELKTTTAKLGVDIANVNQQMATLNANTEKFIQSYKAINGSQFTSVNKEIGKTTTLLAKMMVSSTKMGDSSLKETLKNLRKTKDELKGISGPDFSKMSVDQLLSEVERLDTAWDDIEAKMGSRMKYTKEEGVQVGRIMAQMIEINKLLPKGQKVLQSYTSGGQLFSDTRDFEKHINRALQLVEKQAEETADKIKAVLGDSFSEIIRQQISDIKLTLTLPTENAFVADINDFVAKINAGKGGKINPVNIETTVKNINKDIQSKGTKTATESDSQNNGKKLSPTSQRLQKEIDALQTQLRAKNDQLEAQKNKFKDSTKEVSKKQIAGNDRAVKAIETEIETLKGSIADYQYLITEIENNPGSGLANEVRRWQTTEANIGRAQDRILQKTKEWKNQIIEAMTVSSQELTFEYGWDNSVTVGAQNLQSALERYFADSPVNITIDTDSIGEQIKTAIEEKGVTLGGSGGGTAQLNSQEVVDMIMSLLTGANVSAQVEKAITEEKQEIVQKEVDATNSANNATQQGTENTIRYAAALNKLNINFTDIIAAITEFADATINTDKPAKGGKKASNQLAAWGFDFKKIAKGELTEADFVNMLQNAMMTVNTDGGVQGARIINYLDDVLADRKNNLDQTTGMGAIINRLKEQLHELLKLSGVNVEHVLAEQRRYERFNTYNQVKSAGRTLGNLKQSGYTSVYKDLQNSKIPEIEKLEEIQNKLSQAGEDTSKIDALLEARKTLSDKVDPKSLSDFWGVANAFVDESKAVYQKLYGKVQDFKFVIETDKGTKEINAGSGYLSIPKDANIKEVKIYPTNSYLSTHKGEALPALFNGKRKPPKQDILKEDVGSVAPFKITERETGGIRGGDKGIEVLRETATKAPELKNKVSELETRIQDLSNTIEQLESDLKRLTLTDKPSVSLKSLADANVEINTITGDLRELQGKLSVELARTASFTRQIQEAEQYKSYSKDELNAIIRDANNKINQRRAFDALAGLKNAKNPTKDILFDVRQAASALGDDTLNKELEDLYAKRLRLDEVLNDENASTQRKAANQKVFDRNFNRFVTMMSQGTFDVLFQQAKEVNLQAEIKRQKMAHTAIWEPQKLDAQINDSKQQISASEKEQSQLQAKIDGVNQELIKAQENQRKAIGEISRTFKQVKNTLYKQAEDYVNLLQTLDPKSEGYETVLAKLQQTIGAIQRTQSTFNIFKEITSKPSETKKKKKTPLFNRNRTKNINGWMAQFVTDKPDILSDTHRLLADRENELNATKAERLNTESALKDARRQQDILSDAEKEIAFAKEYNRLLTEEEQHLANIAKLKKQGANQEDIRVEQNALNATQEEFQRFLADNKDNDRHLYALDRAKRYTLQMYAANKQYYAAEKELNKIKKEEVDLNKYPLFTQGAGRYELDDYKTELTNRHVQEFKDSEYAKLREKWGGKRRRDISDADLAEYDADYAKLDDDARTERKRYKDSLKAVTIDGITQLATITVKTVNGVSEEVVNEVVDKNLKTTLAKRLRIDDRKENAQNIYDSRKDIVKGLEREKEKAMRYGQVTDKEVENDKLVHQQKEYLDKLFELQEREKQLISERDRLDKETASYRNKKKDERSPEENEQVTKFKQANDDLEAVQRQIVDYETRIENYEAVIHQTPEDIKKEKDATVELNKVTERLANNKVKLAQVQNEIVTLEKEYDKIADGTPAKEEALAKLEQKRNYARALDEGLKKDRLSATYWAGQSGQIPKTATSTTTSTETTTIKGGLFGALADSIINGVREGFSSISLDPHQSGIATEITLRAIYDLLSGGGTYGEELDRKHAAWQAGHPVVQQPSRSVETSSDKEKQEEKPKKLSKTQQQMARLSEEGQKVWKDIADAAKKTKEEVEGLKKSTLTNKMSKLAQDISTESNVVAKLKKQAQLTEMFYAYKGKDGSFDDTVKKVTALKAFQGITDFEKMLLRDYKARGDALIKAGYGIGEKSGNLGRETNPKTDYKDAVTIVSQALKEAGYNGNIKSPEKLLAIWNQLDDDTIQAGNKLIKDREASISTIEGNKLADAMLKLAEVAMLDYRATEERIAIEAKEIKVEGIDGDSDLQQVEEPSDVSGDDNIRMSQTSTAQGGLPAWIQGIITAVQGLDTGTLASMMGVQKQILEGVNIVSRRSASGKPNGAVDLYEDFRRILESDKWEGRERARYMDYQTGAISNHITGTDKGLSGEALDRLYENYAKSMTINTQLHSHAGFNEPYFSSQDLSTFVGAKRNKNISKQVLISDKNITLLDLSKVADDKLQELVDTLTNTENDFEKLGKVAKKFGARYETLEFNDFEKEITPQKLTKFLGIKGVESKLNQTETKDAAIQGVAEEAAKEAAQVVQKSTGVAVKTTFERIGLEMAKSIEQTDAKGNKTWSTDISNKYQKAMEATHKDIAGQNLGDVFGKGTEAQKALVEYENHYALLNELVEQFKTADESSKIGIQKQINELIPLFDKSEKKLLSLIARKDKFLGDDQALDATFGAKELASPRKNLEKLARQMYGGNVNPGGNVAFGGYKRGQGSGQLFVDVLDGQTKTIKTHVLEVDKATGKVKEYTLAENALSNAFQNVNRAMKQNEYVLADVAIGDGPRKQAEWMANASSPHLDAYKKAFEEMQHYTAQLWNSGKAPSQQQLDYLMQLSERVMVLGKELQKTSSDFKNFWAQNPDAVRGIDFHEGDTVRTAMERYAQTNASANTSKYEFASFDNNTLKYKLTDIEGNVRNVSMVWDELYQKVAIVSDKSVVALDPLVAKIEKYKQVVADAKANEYLLDTDDAKFNAALQEIEALQQKVQEGTATYEELETARRRAIKQGSDAEKLAKKNEKLYAGTNELRSAERQNTKILGTLPETFDKETSAQFQAYQRAYDELIAKHKSFADDHKLTSVEVQKELQRDAAAVQKLGRQFLASANEAEELERRVKNSGSFINRHGKEIQLGGTKAVSTEGLKNLNILMRAYAKEVLGAELAHAKFNPTTQQLTGVIRQNNRVVSDMVVKYNEATGQLYLFQKQERESLSGWPGLIHGFKEKSKAIVQYLASMTSIYRIFGMIRQGITYIKEIDAALTELRKVTDETEETYSKFLDTASKTAYRLGSTLVEVTNATAEFAKLGYSMKMAAEMGEAALVYANVGDGIGSAQEAADSIISTLKGFKLEAKDAMLIVDKFNEVGKLLPLDNYIG